MNPSSYPYTLHKFISPESYILKHSDRIEATEAEGELGTQIFAPDSGRGFRAWIRRRSRANGIQARSCPPRMPKNPPPRTVFVACPSAHTRLLLPPPPSVCLVGGGPQPQGAVTFSGALLNSGQLSGRSRADVSDIFREGGRQSASRDSANKNCAEKGLWQEERTRKHFYATESC